MEDLEILSETPPWEWNEKVAGFLADVLRDTDGKVKDRVLAAELAGETVAMNDELAELLLGIVGNGDEAEELRAKSATSLGPALEFAYTNDFDDPEDEVLSEEMYQKVQESLRELYAVSGIPKLVRRRILEAAVRSPQGWHGDAIREAYASDDNDWKLTAVFGMGCVRGFEKEILESLKSQNTDIHFEAVRASGNWEVKAAWPHIVALISLEDSDKRLLLASIEAVAAIEPGKAEEILGELLESDDEDIVDAVREAFAMAGVGGMLDDPSDEEDEDF